MLRDFLHQIIQKPQLEESDWQAVIQGARDIYQSMIRPAYAILVTQNSHNMSHVLTVGQHPSTESSWLAPPAPMPMLLQPKALPMLEKRAVLAFNETLGSAAIAAGEPAKSKKSKKRKRGERRKKAGRKSFELDSEGNVLTEAQLKARDQRSKEAHEAAAAEHARRISDAQLVAGSALTGGEVEAARPVLPKYEVLENMEYPRKAVYSGNLLIGSDVCLLAKRNGETSRDM